MLKMLLKERAQGFTIFYSVGAVTKLKMTMERDKRFKRPANIL